MEFTNEQKLIITLLTDIHAALKISDSVDPQFVQEVVSNNQGWALDWQYPGIFGGGAEETPEHVVFVTKVLNLWERVEQSYAKLGDVEKADIATQAYPFGQDPAFSGFDGNGADGDAYSTTGLLINRMDKWTTFQGRDLNSHAPMSGAYQRMLYSLDELQKSPRDYYFSPDELVILLKAQAHPDN